MSKVQEKLANCQYNYSKNFFKALIVPVVSIILALIFAFTFGFNKDLDFTGGVVVSVVAGTDVNLYQTETYNNFKQEIDEVLSENNINGKIYTVELNDKQEYTMVVKFGFSGSQTQQESLLESLKLDLVEKFYSETPTQDIENNNYVLVETFGSCIADGVILTTALATLVGVVLMCAYIALRMGINAGILTFVSALLNNILTVSLIMITRIPLTYATVAVVPFVSIISIISSFIYLRKNKELLSTTERYAKQSNESLANDTVKQTSFNQILLCVVATVASLILGLFNINNSILFLSLAFVVAILSVLYTNIMLLPGLFAKTYVRKVKKVKAKEQKNQEKRLTEEQVMQETDLDNLVSN
ncbi:MAG: hypothetical protein E7376_00720 [Clostridiales bacterium]|nr:hypothetical protein [Clostridiales bacterium]